MYVVIDTETTGLPDKKGKKFYPPEEIAHYDTARLLELAYCLYDENGSQILSFNKVVKPQGFSGVGYFQNITQDEQNAGENVEMVIEEFGNFMEEMNKKHVEKYGNPISIVAHNLNFDISIILSEAYRTKNLKFVEIIGSLSKKCTILISMSKLNLHKYPKLTELYFMLFGKKVSEAHRALEDVKICAECYKTLSIV